MSVEQPDLYKGGIRRREFRQPAGAIDMFVSREQEAEYLREHSMELRRLNNGAVLIGASDQVHHAFSRVTLSLPSSPLFEPPGKRGVTHLWEHLVGKDVSDFAYPLDVKCGPMTSLSGLKFVTEGPAHLDVPDYGIWPVLPVLMDKLTGPFTATQDDLLQEQRRILAEFQNRTHGLDSPRIRNDFFLERALYSPGHPTIGHPMGTPEEIAALTLEDAAVYHHHLASPRGLVGQVRTWGKPEITTKIMDELDERIGSMPDPGVEPPRPSRATLDTLSPYYIQGAVTEKNTGRLDGQQDIYYLWAMQTAPFSELDINDGNLFDDAKFRMKVAYQKAAIGYPFAAFRREIGDTMVYVFQLTIKAVDDPKTVAVSHYPAFREATFGSYGDEDFDRIRWLTQRRAAAAVVTPHERLNQAVKGLDTYGQIIDAGQVLVADQLVTTENLRASRDRFASMKPTILIEK